MLTESEVADWFRSLQDEICLGLEKTDGKHFHEDLWERPGGGGGRTRILKDGNIIQKGGVNFSSVFGKAPKFLLSQHGLTNPDSRFFATGVSIVMHPLNPFVPIMHMNVRHLRVADKWWFGGGIDLTPHYVNREEAAFFHSRMKAVCDKHDEQYYPEFKKQADDYFFLKHRNETRGVGGIFFDHLSGPESQFDRIWNFIKDVGKEFFPVYSELMKNNHQTAFEERHAQWQRIRRGRYVEFNLLYDRGTKFGLETDGRTESILMSLPPLASWEYDFQPPAGSPERETISSLKKDIDWLV